MGLPIATPHATRELRGAPRVRRHRDTEERAELKKVSALAPAESRTQSLADHKARSSNDWVRAMQRVCDPSAIMDVDAGPAPQRTSRKHQLSSDGDNSNCSSDESGRFDDAEEAELDDYRSPSTKSVKRRRSNDWPLPEEAADYGQHDRRNARSGNVVLGATYKASPRASPRGSVTSLHGRYKSSSHSPHHRLGRRSRFVEATMSDSVSEKPPSIFLRDGKPPGASNRQSGIFRFGKAIASAFNPFGGWGKSSPENVSKTEPQKDALTQAEEAYAELKKAGFKGTNKGAYLQSQSVDPARADQTWQAIQEKMGYGAGTSQPPWPSMAQEEPSTPSRSSSKASKRSSFQDLRKAKSLSIPFMKPHESPVMAPSRMEPTSEDSEVPGVRRQKSRKELSRQAKLLKKVSNLEDKLERARRELRQLSGNEQRTPAPLPETKVFSMEMDPGSYPRKFVPGALPTLPSERLLDQQATILESPEIEPVQLTALPSSGRRGSISVDKAFPVDNEPSARSSPGTRRSMSKESSSRKRKSPVPEPIASRNPVQPRPTDRFNDDRFGHEQLIDVGLLSPPRQAKWQKMEAGDSPGSVERQRNIDSGALTTAQEGVKHKRSPYVPSRRSSPSIVRSPKSKTIRSPPPLRMRQARSHLPSLSPSNPDVLAESAISRWFSPSPPPDVAHDAFYLQQHRKLDPDRTPRSSPSSLATVSRKRRSVPDADIPPVPPLPKDLLMNAAKVNSSPAKIPKPGNHRAAADHSPLPSLVQSQQSPGLKDFLWPEDIF
ncbi:uncharacterized protein N7459_006366 [Penicillium hispanicum]|uniref:uncharacterized protein n=1 Tax=Penicillium hispanicum TaxID=1080232 RepID=UPI00253FFC69|nr:uncharacterized protein N7459_006366 [Penicillium hispanicum]KAJ5577402.1 hypothetical protein N7459_006366 [Penicillium hispanicum]